MRRMIYSFDLDNTLLATAELNRHAYATVGITVPPEAFGKAWHEWLPTLVNNDVDAAVDIHRRKSAIYMSALINANYSQLELAPARVARELMRRHGRESVVVITASSTRTAGRIIERVLGSNITWHAGVTLPERVSILQQQMTRGFVTYVDDNEATIQQLTLQPPDRLLPVHFTGESDAELHRKMRLP